MHTPIPQILLAQQGLIDWHRLLNGPSPKETEKPPIEERLKKAFRALGAKPVKAGEMNGEN